MVIMGAVQQLAGPPTMYSSELTTTGEIRKEAHISNKSLADPKTKVKVGCWNVRTMFSVSTTVQITTEMDRYGIGTQRQRVKVMGRGGDSSEGQNNLEGESVRPNSLLGETWKLMMNKKHITIYQHFNQTLRLQRGQSV